MESISRPLHRRKLCTANSLSGQSAYDGVLTSGHSNFGAPATFSSRVQDYTEIFRVRHPSSIPVLDVSALADSVASADYRSSKVDYSKIFGGFGDESVGVSYEDLVSKPNGGKKKASRKVKSPPKADSTSPKTAKPNSSDDVKQFNMPYQKTSQRSKDGSSGTTHIATLDAVPGFACFIDEVNPSSKKESNDSKASVMNDVRCNMDSGEGKTDVEPSEKPMPPVHGRETSDGVDKLKRGCSWDGSYISDKFFNANEVNNGSHPAPSSIPHNGNNVKRHSKRSMSSTFEMCKADASEGVNGGSPPYFDDELDENSAAAASAAALRKAIEKAQESIRLAKVIIERKKDGLRGGLDQSFKDSLKVKDNRGSIVSSKGDKVQEEEIGLTLETVDSVFQSSGVTKRNDAIENGKIALGIQHGEDVSDARMVMGKTNWINRQSTKESEESGWLSKLVNLAKQGPKFVGFRHAEEKDDIVQSKDKCEHINKESERAVETLETHGLADESRNVNDLLPISKCLNEESKVEMFEKNPNPHALKNDFARTGCDSQEPVECMKKKEEVSEESKVERFFDSCEMEADDDGLTKFNDEDEIRKENSEVYHWLGNENKLKEVFTAIESDKEQRNDANVLDGTKKGLIEALKPEIDERNPNDAHAWEESERRSEDGFEREENGSIARPCKCEDIDSIEYKSDQLTESERINLANEVAHGNDFDISTYACDSDENTRINELHGTSGYEVIDENVETGQDSVVNEEAKSTLGVTENSSVFEGNDDLEEVVMMSCNEVPEADDFAPDATKEIEIENNTKTSSEESGVVKMTPIEVFKTAGFVQSVDDGKDIESKAKDEAEASLPDNNAGLNSEVCVGEVEQNDKEIEEASSLTNDMDMFSRKTKEEENLKEEEILFTDGKGKIDSEIAHLSGECFREVQEMELCQSHELSEDKEKSVESDGDITTGESLESEEMNATQSSEEAQTGQNTESDEESRTSQNMENDQVVRTAQCIQTNEEEVNKSSKMDEKETKGATQRVTEVKEKVRNNAESNQREKDKIAVERAIREARERAFAEARERAAMERAIAEGRHRVMADEREKLEKSSSVSKSLAEKSSISAKLRAERAAVERATAEARERALEKALSMKTNFEARPQTDRHTAEKSSNASRENILRHSFSSSDLERFDGTNQESAQRRKARLERHQRIVERAAKALAEKNKRDLLVQKEQAERNRLAEILDADIKRWASGKEGNLRALLSTLQYILGPDSGWQSISLTDLITTNAVKKAYRKAALYVHPDKLQQRGASIQQKYVCEKVFDLLKAAWNRFNSEER